MRLTIYNNLAHLFCHCFLFCLFSGFRPCNFWHQQDQTIVNVTVKETSVRTNLETLVLRSLKLKILQPFVFVLFDIGHLFRLYMYAHTLIYIHLLISLVFTDEQSRCRTVCISMQYCQDFTILANQVRKSWIYPWDSNSYLSQFIVPRVG